MVGLRNSKKIICFFDNDNVNFYFLTMTMLTLISQVEEDKCGGELPDIASLRRDFIGTPNPFSAERRLRVSRGLRLRVPLARLRQREKRRRVRAKENRRRSDRYQVKDWGDGS